MKFTFANLFAFLLALSVAPAAKAYPEFIAYGYTSCMTCHYSGQGSGPLNDYGRALWSLEIAARTIYPKSMTDEDIGMQSGFLGSVELPTWFRPHAKYREVYLRRNFRSANDVSKFYRMQADVGFTLTDAVGKYVGMITYGNVSKAGDNKIQMVPREYYFRTELVKTYWLYLGLLEKVFGNRNIDHESFQRKPQGFRYTKDEVTGMAQSHGFIMQKIEENWDVALNGFVGNPHDQEKFRQKGASLQGEYGIGEKKRLGMSLYSGKSEVLKKDMVAVHYRQEIALGSAVLMEYGLIQDELTGQVKTVGSYNSIQSLIALTRGYNLKATVERYNGEFKSTVPEVWRWSAGILAFPMPRLEVRAEVINGRIFSDLPVADDNWTLQGQIHVSL